MDPRGGLTQFDGDADLVASPPHAALDEVTHAEDPAGVAGMPFALQSYARPGVHSDNYLFCASSNVQRDVLKRIWVQETEWWSLAVT